jgi:hypothetical protein
VNQNTTTEADEINIRGQNSKIEMETLWKKWTRKKKKGKYKMQFDHIKDYKVKITFKERNRLINQKKK